VADPKRVVADGYDAIADRYAGAAGFELLRDRVIPYEEPGHGLVRFMWILAQRPF
jgi:hypothetical protein